MEIDREERMKRLFTVALPVAVIIIGTTIGASVVRAENSALVGEIRAIAVSAGSPQTVSSLHQSGWIEAHGQILSVSQFPELFAVIGRDWTATGVSKDSFAIPNVRDERHYRQAANNVASRALGASDVITSGRRPKMSSRTHPISYWIFVGRAVSDAG
jgi:hypothetical protein